MIYKLKHPDHLGVAKVLTNAEGIPISIYVDGEALVSGLDARGVWTEHRLAVLRGQGWHITVVQDLNTQERIALWCRLYKLHKGLPYRVSGADAGKMKNLQVTEALLNWYLNDAKAAKAGAAGFLWKGKQSIGNLAKYWNEVRTAMVAPEPSPHPDHWDAKHYARLDGPGISAYFRHLRSLGLVPKKHKDGTIIDFVKP